MMLGCHPLALAMRSCRSRSVSNRSCGAYVRMPSAGSCTSIGAGLRACSAPVQLNTGSQGQYNAIGSNVKEPAFETTGVLA